jgi:phosphoserine phosphatase
LKVVLISAGLSLVTERIKREIGVDDSSANDLKVENGLLTGQVKVKVSVHNKHAVLDCMLRKFKLRMDECVAIGDDETLIPLFERVGFSIAFNPRSVVVEEHADIVVKSDDLREVLPILALRT